MHSVSTLSTRPCVTTCRAEVDGYLSSRGPAAWLSGLRGRLLLPPGEVVVAGTHYDVPLLNALVFYVGIRVRAPVAAAGREKFGLGCGRIGGVSSLRHGQEQPVP